MTSVAEEGTVARVNVTTYDIRPERNRSHDRGARTRERILDAVRELILHRHHSDFSVAEVAAAAGVTHRTVYRHFADKQTLIAAVAERPTDDVPGLEFPQRWPEAAARLTQFWQFFGEHLDDLRAERLVPGGLQLRRARLARGRELVRHLLRDAGISDGPGLDRLTEVVVLLTSSGSLLELVDRHGLSVEEATELIVDAVEHLVEAAR